MVVYVTVVAVVIVAFFIGVYFPPTTSPTPSPSAPAITILPDGTFLRIPTAGHVVVGPVNLTSQPVWGVSLSFTSNLLVDVFGMNWSQFQLWNPSTGTLPSQYDGAFLETNGGGTCFWAGVPLGMYYYLWFDANSTYPATVMIENFTAAS